MLGPISDRVVHRGRKALQWFRAAARRRPILTGIVAVLLSALIIAGFVTSADGRRASLAFAALAKSANDAGNTDVAALYALRGLRGNDTFLFGYQADEARTELLKTLTEKRAVLRMEMRLPYDAAFSPDSGKIALLVSEGVQIVDSVTGKDTIAPWVASGWERPIGIAFNAAGDLIAATFEDGGVLLHAEDGTAKARLAGKEKLVSAPTFNAAGTLVAAAASDAVVIWNVVDGQPRLRLPGECAKPGFSADGKHLLAVCADRALHRWDVMSGEAVAQIALEDAARVDESYRVQIDAVPAFRADIASRGARVLSVTRKGVFVWSTGDGRLLRHLPHGSYFKQIATLSDDGSRLALSGSAEGVCARIWDVASGREQIVVHHDMYTPIYAVIAFSADSNRLLTAKSNGIDTIVWDVAATPDSNRLVAAPGWLTDRAPLSALSGADLFEHACSVGDRFGALRASDRELATIQKIAAAESVYTCETVALVARVRAAFGLWTPEYSPRPVPMDDGAKRLPPALRVTYDYGSGRRTDRQATIWIENQGARMGLRDHNQLLAERSEAYWDGKRTFTRNNDDVVTSTPFLSRNFFRLPFDPYDKRLSAQEQMGLPAFSLYRFAPERTDKVAGRPCTVWTDKVPPKENDGDETTPPQPHHELCIWNGLVISETQAVNPGGTFGMRRVATEIVENEPIPADIKALAIQ